MVNKKIFILTNFSTFLRSYSPIIVVGEQLKMFKRNGYEPVMIVADGWDPPEDTVFFGVDTVYLSPVAYQDPPEINDIFHQDVNLIYEQLKDAIHTDDFNVRIYFGGKCLKEKDKLCSHNIRKNLKNLQTNLQTSANHCGNSDS